MLTTKYIIKKTSYFDGDKYLKGDICNTYFVDFAEGNVPIFDYKKKRAKRYETYDEATEHLRILKEMHSPILFIFNIIQIRCRA